MAIRTLIFDFGNVVGFFDHRLTTQKLVPHTDLPAGELHTTLFGSELEEAYDTGRVPTPDFLRQVQHSCRLRCSEEYLAEAWADIFRPNAEVCALIPRLQARYPLLLGSNTNELHARQFLRQFADTLGHFRELVLSFRIGARKPQAAFFEHCRRQAGCAPEECLFIDDLAANVEAARSCGLQGLIYRDPEDLLAQFRDKGILV